jgi:hypothetical protein
VLSAVSCQVEDGRVTAIHLITSPEKLAALEAGRVLPL